MCYKVDTAFLYSRDRRLWDNDHSGDFSFIPESKVTLSIEHKIIP